MRAVSQKAMAKKARLAICPTCCTRHAAEAPKAKTSAAISAAGRVPAAIAEEHQRRQAARPADARKHIGVDHAEARRRREQRQQDRGREDQRLRIGDLRRAAEDVVVPERRLAAMQRLRTGTGSGPGNAPWRRRDRHRPREPGPAQAPPSRRRTRGAPPDTAAVRAAATRPRRGRADARTSRNSSSRSARRSHVKLDMPPSTRCGAPPPSATAALAGALTRGYAGIALPSSSGTCPAPSTPPRPPDMQAARTLPQKARA